MSHDTSKIGVSTATITGMNAMIGAGIFTAPAVMASNVGPAGIIAYLFVVFAVWFMAQSIARVAYLYPQEGSFYVYAKQWGGHAVGLIASASYFMGLLIAMGLLSRVAGFYLHDIVPIASPTVLSLMVLWGLVILNMFGLTLSELGQRVLIFLTVFPLLVTTIICFLNADASNLFPFAPYGLTNVLKATRVVIFGFFGFECAASLFSVVKNPEQNVPKALTYSIIIVGIIYTLFISSIIMAAPASLFAQGAVKVPTILASVFPGHPWLIAMVHIAILSAIIGTIHSMIWSSSALLVSLLKLVRPSKKPVSQSLAVFLVGCVICFTCLTLTNVDLFFYLTALFIITSFILSMITLLTLRSEWRNKQNVKTIIGIATGLLIFYFAAHGLYEEMTNTTVAQQQDLVHFPEE